MECTRMIDPSSPQCIQTIESIYPFLEQLSQEQAGAIISQLQIKIDQAIQFQAMMHRALQEEPSSTQQ